MVSDYKEKIRNLLRSTGEMNYVQLSEKLHGGFFGINKDLMEMVRSGEVKERKGENGLFVYSLKGGS